MAQTTAVPSTSKTGPALALWFLIAALLGAAAWWVWCGFDTTYYPEGTGGPYTTWQVVCSGASFLAIVVVGTVLSRRQNVAIGPLLVSAGAMAGYWLSWTIQAAFYDDSGLFAVGAILLGIGLLLGTAVGVGLGFLLSALLRYSPAGQSRSTKPRLQ